MRLSLRTAALGAAAITALITIVIAVAAATGLFPSWRAATVRVDPHIEIDPAKQYVLQLWDYRWPPFTPGQASYETWLKGAIIGFNRLHPNVRVEFRLLDWRKGPGEFLASLAAGTPPDVYAPPPNGPALFSRELQVPAGLYLEDSRDHRESEDYLAAAWPPATLAGKVWGWPRWLAARVWLGNGAVLQKAAVDIGAVHSQGWSREAFAAALRQRPPGTAGMTFNHASPLLMEDLLRAQGFPSPISPEGYQTWTTEAVETTAGWLADLRKGGLIPNAGARDNMVDDVLHGRAAVLAGVSPWLGARLLRIEPNLVMLPIPSPPGGQPLLPLTAGQILIFRQREYKGHDHTRAAAELARFLSRVPHPWAQPDTTVLPAYRPARERWLTGSKQERQESTAHFLQHALAWAQPVPGRTAAVSGQEELLMESEVMPAIREFWEGKLDAGGLARRIGAKPAPPEPARRPWWRLFQ